MNVSSLGINCACYSEAFEDEEETFEENADVYKDQDEHGNGEWVSLAYQANLRNPAASISPILKQAWNSAQNYKY